MTADRPQARCLIFHPFPSPFCRRPAWWCLLLVVFLAFSLPPSALAAKARKKVPPKPQGVIHVVGEGQTLFRISQAYQVKVAKLMEANRLKASTSLRVGQRLFIPGAKTVKKVEASHALAPAEREALELSLSGEAPALPPGPPPPQPHVKTDADFLWPIVGSINSPFGPRWGKFHAGIDIGSPHYQEVVAAADGEVLYANETRGALGRAVVLQHGHSFRTVYAHLSIIIAREGDTVRQGQAIGGVGETGRTTGPHLHFEIRRNGVALNPEDYLPATIDELVQDLSRKRQVR
ncbi:MAG TPA: LysM peptidoglycan-binding domain-containing M23 family metallopeptidase [Candidatus Methylomirabilis sp.]|nr:LysM peptidoglycan-binding domain-containing M23 family metallopeptidase [Candidatus Methylomirabilis sp.]